MTHNSWENRQKCCPIHHFSEMLEIINLQDNKTNNTTEILVNIKFEVLPIVFLRQIVYRTKILENNKI